MLMQMIEGELTLKVGILSWLDFSTKVIHVNSTLCSLLQDAVGGGEASSKHVVFVATAN